MIHVKPGMPLAARCALETTRGHARTSVRGTTWYPARAYNRPAVS